MLMPATPQPIPGRPLIVPLRSGFMVLVNCGTCQERMAGETSGQGCLSNIQLKMPFST